jgi:hypothetical protein
MVFIRGVDQENGKNGRAQEREESYPQKKGGNELQVLGEHQSRPEKHQKKLETVTRVENWPLKRAVMNCEHG